MENKTTDKKQISSALLKSDKFKCSLFNFLFVRNNAVYLFNTLRETFLEILPKEKDKYSWLGNESIKIENKTIDIKNNWESMNEKAREHLISGGFVIPDDFDEIEYLKFKNKTETTRSDYASVTIALTYACNMNCVYCYEEAPVKNGTISKETANDIIKYIGKLVSKGCKYLDITWYGGEPMLRYELILSLSKQIIELCKTNKIKYSASIITNGVLLTKEKAQKLKEHNVDFAQITIDGPENIHNQRRPLKTGPSFDIIISNIKEINDVMNISIRCNLDKSNSNDAKALVDYIAEIGLAGKVSINFAPVTDRNQYQQGSCSCKGCNVLYNYESFSSVQAELVDYALDKKLHRPSLPYKKFCACMADRSNSVVIEPDGNLVKCWEYIGNKNEAVGNLTSGVILNSKNLKWFNYTAFNYDFCRECKLLPACMGWCPARLMAVQNESACNTTKYNIIKNLIRYHEYKKHTEQTKGGEL